MEVLVVILVVAVLGLLVYLGLHARSRALVGPIRLATTNLHPELGEEISIELSIRPPGAPTLNELTLTLRAYEWIRWTETRTSTDSKGRTTTRTVTRTRTETLYARTWREQLGYKVVPNARYEVEANVRIPRSAPPSFTRAPNNQIRWELHGTVDIAGLPDLSETSALNVQPILHPED